MNKQINYSQSQFCQVKLFMIGSQIRVMCITKTTFTSKKYKQRGLTFLYLLITYLTLLSLTLC